MGLWSFRTQSGFADRDWWAAAVMEGMDEEQKLDPLSGRKSNVEKRRITETLKMCSAVKICAIKHSEHQKYDCLRLLSARSFQKGGRFNS